MDFSNSLSRKIEVAVSNVANVLSTASYNYNCSAITATWSHVWDYMHDRISILNLQV